MYDARVVWLWILIILGLKIPPSLMVYAGWRMGKRTDEAVAADRGEGGSAVTGEAGRRHPRPPFPREPRRSPHGDPSPPAPARTRRIPPGTRVLRG